MTTYDAPAGTRDARATALAVRRGRCSAEEVVEAHLAVVARLNPDVNALVHVDAEGALAAARSLDERVAAGLRAGALAGVPVAVKDNIDVGGQMTSARVGRPAAGERGPRRHRGDPAAGRRRDPARPGQHGRARHGRLDPDLGVRPDPQPARPPPQPRRQQRRLGGRGRLRDGAAVAGHRHRRLGPRARVAVRPGRDGAVPGPGAAARRAAVRPRLRHGRAAGAHGGRRPPRPGGAARPSAAAPPGHPRPARRTSRSCAGPPTSPGCSTASRRRWTGCARWAARSRRCRSRPRRAAWTPT